MNSRGPSLKQLRQAYRKIKPNIKERLAEFRKILKENDEKIFSELCYCILTANANAVLCNDAIKELERTKLLLKGKLNRIRPLLKGRVRFHNKKACYIVGARDFFKKAGCAGIKDKLHSGDIIKTRDWLVEKIKGFGYKEASHFLRNIGLGKKIAILDRHILKNLKRYGVIDNIPDSVGNRKIYIDIENKMKKFSNKVRIPLEDLDLLFWSIQTGYIFK